MTQPYTIPQWLICANHKKRKRKAVGSVGRPRWSTNREDGPGSSTGHAGLAKAGEGRRGLGHFGTRSSTQTYRTQRCTRVRISLGGRGGSSGASSGGHLHCRHHSVVARTTGRTWMGLRFGRRHCVNVDVWVCMRVSLLLKKYARKDLGASGLMLKLLSIHSGKKWKKKKKNQNDKRLTAGELGQEHTTLQPSLTSINLNIEMTKWHLISAVKHK